MAVRRKAARGIVCVANAMFRIPRGEVNRIFIRELSNRASSPPRFAIAFDIDGVLLRGGKPIGGAPTALRRLYDDPALPAKLHIPYIFLTNGGGSTEASRATELSQQLDVPVLPDQMRICTKAYAELCFQHGLGGVGKVTLLCQRSDSHLKTCISMRMSNSDSGIDDRHSFKNQRVLAIGKGEPDVVLKSYGFEHVIDMDSYVNEFESIDGLAQFKPWNQSWKKVVANPLPDHHVSQITGVFVVSDPIEWSRDMQVICDILRSGGKPGREWVVDQPQPPLFFAADDLDYQSTFPIPRLGMGAFRVGLESIYNRLPGAPLQYVSYGKPQLSVYRNAERVLESFFTKISAEVVGEGKHHPFSTIYMIGDNPSTDILGAKFAGWPWFSILTRTGCYRGQPISSLYQADKIVDDVEEAVDFIIQRENGN